MESGLQVESLYYIVASLGGMTHMNTVVLMSFVIMVKHGTCVSFDEGLLLSSNCAQP